MEIKYGKRYDNKTYRYLLPAFLEGCGKIFKLKFKELSILACGIDDKLLYNKPKFDFLSEKKPIFVILDTAYNKRKAEDFVYWINYQDFFLGKYYIDTTSRAIMLIFDFPKEYERAYDNFIVGKYSDMYSREDIEKLFPVKNSSVYHVLIRNTDKLLPDFVKKLEDIFSTNLKYTDFLEAEMELPYKLSEKEEVFNFETI